MSECKVEKNLNEERWKYKQSQNKRGREIVIVPHDNWR